MITLRFTVQNEEHSKQIQDEIFSLGGGWKEKGSYDISQEYQNLNKPFLHIKSSAQFNCFGDLTGEKFLDLMYAEKVNDTHNFADELPAHIARKMPSDLSIIHDVTLENYKSFFNKISFKSQYEKILASKN